MGSLLSGAVCNTNENEPDNLLGKLLGGFPEKVPGSFPRRLPGKVLTRAGRRLGEGRTSLLDGQARASFFATATMIVTGPILMSAPKDRPLTDQRRRSGSRQHEGRQQIAHFGVGQNNERVHPL